MDTIRIKTILAGIWGGGSAWGTFFMSEECDLILRRALQGLGVVSVALSIYYVWRINSSRARIKAIDEIKAESRLCDLCITGHQEPNGDCPVPIEHRHKNCPKEFRKKKQTSRIHRLLKNLGLIYSDETKKK